MDDTEILSAAHALELEVDEGATIGGPFIPDGIVRVYDPATSTVLGSGKTLQEAWDDSEGRR